MYSHSASLSFLCDHSGSTTLSVRQKGIFFSFPFLLVFFLCLKSLVINIFGEGRVKCSTCLQNHTALAEAWSYSWVWIKVIQALGIGFGERQEMERRVQGGNPLCEGFWAFKSDFKCGEQDPTPRIQVPFSVPCVSSMEWMFFLLFPLSASMQISAQVFPELITLPTEWQLIWSSQNLEYQVSVCLI